LADLLSDTDIFNYSEIPNYPETTVSGHVSRLLFGTLEGVSVMLMQGRFHTYEGYAMEMVRLVTEHFSA